MATDWIKVREEVRRIIDIAVGDERRFGACDPNYMRAKIAVSYLSDAQHLIGLHEHNSLSNASDIINRVKLMLCDIMDDHDPRKEQPQEKGVSK